MRAEVPLWTFRRLGAVARPRALRWDIDVCALTIMVRLSGPQTSGSVFVRSSSIAWTKPSSFIPWGATRRATRRLKPAFNLRHTHDAAKTNVAGRGVNRLALARRRPVA